MIRLLRGAAAVLLLSACISDEKVDPDAGAVGGNLLMNSELSDGDCQGWEINGTGKRVEDTGAPSPPHACHLCYEVSDGDQITISQSIDAISLVPGANYQAQGFFRVSDDLALHDLSIGLSLVDKDGNVVAGGEKTVLPAAAWTPATALLNYDPAKHGVSVVVGFNDRKTGVGQRCYDVDNITLTKM